MDRKRIALLDSYRAIAILLVICFHYFSRWTPPRYGENRYPYGALLRDIPLIDYGYLGVEFFFMISGFVIALTLHDTTSWQAFAARRFARLFPAMLICSLLTFAVKLAAPALQLPFSVYDLLPGLTFIAPEVWQALLGHTFQSMDGPYWSLYVEVKLYFWAALLYFTAGRDRFLFAFALFFNAIMAQLVFAKLAHLEWWMPGIEALFTFDYLPWFAVGVGFFFLRENRHNKLALALLAEAIILLLLFALRWREAVVLPFYLVFFALFGVLSLRQEWLHCLTWKPLAAIGAASYSLYLLHDAIGLTLITLLSNALQLNGSPTSVLVAFGVLALMIALSMLSYRVCEIPGRRLVMRLISARLPGP